MSLGAWYILAATRRLRTSPGVLGDLGPEGDDSRCEPGSTIETCLSSRACSSEAWMARKNSLGKKIGYDDRQPRTLGGLGEVQL